MQKSIIYNGKKYGLRHCINNVKREYNNTLSIYKNDWYLEANYFARYLSKKSGYSLQICCGVISALSPLKSWLQNKSLAIDFLILKKYYGHTELFNKKAYDIIYGANIEKTLNGQKIISFYNNILNPSNLSYITIDRHAVNIALNEKKYSGSINYEFFKTVYIKAANELNINVLLLQSATWQSWRSKNQYKKK